MSDTPGIAELVRDLNAIIERMDQRPAGPFSPEEVERIKRAADLVEWFDTLGWIGKRLMGLIAAVVLLISQWERIREFFIGGGQ